MEQVNDKAVVEQMADTFTMVYTPFHGTGYKLIPEALKRLGMKHVICVPSRWSSTAISPLWSPPTRRTGGVLSGGGAGQGARRGLHPGL